MDTESVWQQMKDFIDEHLPEDEFVVGEWAEKIQAQAEEEIPHVLARFEAELARQQIATYLSSHIRHGRNSAARRIRGAKTDEAILAAVESGDVAFFAKHIPVKDNVTKQIGKTNKDDCSYLRDFHADRGNYHVLESKFWEQVARKLRGDKMFSDVMSESDAVRLYRSITARPFPKAA